MFKHILICTDGSPLANKAAKAGIALAHNAATKQKCDVIFMASHGRCGRNRLKGTVRYRRRQSHRSPEKGRLRRAHRYRCQGDAESQAQ